MAFIRTLGSPVPTRFCAVRWATYDDPHLRPVKVNSVCSGDRAISSQPPLSFL